MKKSTVAANAMTMMVNSMNKARQEQMMIVKSGSPLQKAFVVVNGESAYNVLTDGKQVISCDCPHHVYRNTVCKHMIKVSFEKNLDVKVPELG